MNEDLMKLFSSKRVAHSQGLVKSSSTPTASFPGPDPKNGAKFLEERERRIKAGKNPASVDEFLRTHRLKGKFGAAEAIASDLPKPVRTTRSTKRQKSVPNGGDKGGVEVVAVEDAPVVSSALTVEGIIAMDRKSRRRIYRKAVDRISEEMDVLAKCGDAFHQMTLNSPDPAAVAELKEKLARAEANFKTCEKLAQTAKSQNKELQEKLNQANESQVTLLEDVQREKSEKEVALAALLKGKAKLLERAELERFKTAKEFIFSDSFRQYNAFSYEMTRQEWFDSAQKQIEPYFGKTLPTDFLLDMSLNEKGEKVVEQYPTAEELDACEFREVIAPSNFKQTTKFLPDWIPEVLHSMSLPPTSGNLEFNTELMDINAPVKGWSHPFSLAKWEEAQSKTSPGGEHQYVTGSGHGSTEP